MCCCVCMCMHAHVHKDMCAILYVCLGERQKVWTRAAPPTAGDFVSRKNICSFLFSWGPFTVAEKQWKAKTALNSWEYIQNDGVQAVSNLPSKAQFHNVLHSSGSTLHHLHTAGNVKSAQSLLLLPIHSPPPPNACGSSWKTQPLTVVE